MFLRKTTLTVLILPLLTPDLARTQEGVRQSLPDRPAISSSGLRPDAAPADCPLPKAPLFGNGGATKAIDTRERTGLDNGLLSVAFDKRTGALVRLKNLTTGDEYLKSLGGDGNPFRAYVDTTELPRVLRQGAPWPTPPVEDAMGGTLVDPRRCRLEQSLFRRSGGSGARNPSGTNSKVGIAAVVSRVGPETAGIDGAKDHEA